VFLVKSASFCAKASSPKKTTNAATPLVCAHAQWSG
jgi:hypothetical protein